MTKKILKLFSCLAVMLMVATIIPYGALAAENDQSDNEDMKLGKMNRFADHEMERSDLREKFQNEMAEFESDEEKFEYLLDKMSESIERRIEAFESIDFDEVDNERITAENVAERLANLEQAQEALNEATTLEDLKEIREGL